jgi:hypothetical protein
MTDADIHAFGAPPQPPAPAAPPRRRWRPWLLAGGLLFVFAALVIVAGVLRELTLLAAPGFDVRVDGEPVWPAEFGFGTMLLALGGVLLALLLVAVVVPVALLLALLGVAVGLGGPLLLVLALAALLLSPLWLAGLALWLVLRRPRRPAAESRP